MAPSRGTNVLAVSSGWETNNFGRSEDTNIFWRLFLLPSTSINMSVDVVQTFAFDGMTCHLRTISKVKQMSTKRFGYHDLVELQYRRTAAKHPTLPFREDRFILVHRGEIVLE